MREPQLSLKVPNFWIGSRKEICLIFRALRQIVYCKKPQRRKEKRRFPKRPFYFPSTSAKFSPAVRKVDPIRRGLRQALLGTSLFKILS